MWKVRWFFLTVCVGLEEVAACRTDVSNVVMACCRSVVMCPFAAAKGKAPLPKMQKWVVQWVTKLKMGKIPVVKLKKWVFAFGPQN